MNKALDILNMSIIHLTKGDKGFGPKTILCTSEYGGADGNRQVDSIWHKGKYSIVTLSKKYRDPEKGIN